MRHRESADRQSLDAFWDDFVLGKAFPEPAGNDEQLVALLQDLYRPPLPTPRFRDRLQEDLDMAASTSVHAASLVAPEQLLLPTIPNAPCRKGSSASFVMPQPRVQARLSSFAAIAALILVLATASLPFILPRLRGQAENLTVISALVAPEQDVAPSVQEITGGDDPLEEPSGVAVAPDGTIYVVDAARDQIRVFHADGTPKAAWGASGDGPGEFGFSFDVHVGDIAIAPDGNLYVLDPDNARVQKFTPDGEFLLGWGALGAEAGQFLSAMGIAVDGDGQVYVADFGNHNVQVFTGNGDHIASWDGIGSGDSLAGPEDVAIAPDGTVWVTDSILQRVFGFDANGRVVKTIGTIGDDPGELRAPRGIVAGPMGNLYIAEYDNDRVQVLAPDGASLGIIGASGDGPGEFVDPSYLAIGPDGAVYVTDEGTGRAQKFAAPALTPTTILTPQRAPVKVQPLLDLVIPAATHKQAWVQIDQYTFPAGSTLNADTIDSGMSDVYYLLEGSIDVVADDLPAPARLVRADGSQTEELLGNTQHATLTSGDAIVFPENGTFTLSTSPTSAAIVLHLLQPIDVSHPTDPDILYQHFEGKIRNLHAPVTMTLDKVTLAPGATIPGTDAPTVTQLVTPIDQDRRNDAESLSNGAFRNVSDTPLETYLLTVTSSASEP